MRRRMKTISIAPAGVGWMMRSDAIGSELLFHTGASAESAAVRLAQGLAEVGRSARVEIHLNDGALGRKFLVPALKLVEPFATLAADPGDLGLPPGSLRS